MASPAAEPGALRQGRRLRTMQALSLLLTSGTLVCCVLPATLVLLGAGSVLATLVSHVPAVVVLSEHKGPVFGLAGAALALAGLGLWRQVRRGRCPSDPRQRLACQRLQRQALALFAVSLGGYGLAVVVTFVLPLLG